MLESLMNFLKKNFSSIKIRKFFFYEDLQIWLKKKREKQFRPSYVHFLETAVIPNGCDRSKRFRKETRRIKSPIYAPSA